MSESELLAEVSNLLQQFVDEPNSLANLTPRTHLQDELAIASVHYVDLLIALEKRYQIVLDDAEIFGLERVSDLIELIQRKTGGVTADGSTIAGAHAKEVS